eukprot:TRINITY_DN3198_c0_g1_i3.p1 TRINITY_DN3198_c0_g1~~TRINITY_DN3198_c0_g1_i3.p1  ORF type:complete len:1237 (+),score=310.06 TRINITY_DN3198_c0_g1_i3:59-3712(+)
MSQLVDWEHAKENIQPLKTGRDPSKLSGLFKDGQDASSKIEEQRRLYEAALHNNNDDDKLMMWINYITWAQQTFPAEQNQQVLPLLQRCTTELEENPMYQNDIRYLKIWVVYAGLVHDPVDIFTHLEEKRIGQAIGLLYEAWASVLEERDRIKDADKVFQLGITRNAQPLEKLKQRYKEFQARSMLRITQIAAQKSAPNDENDSARAPLGNLSRAGPVGTMRAPVKARAPALGVATKRKGVPSGANENIAVYDESNDDNGGYVPSVPAPRAGAPPKTFASDQERYKENTAQPGRWDTARIPQKKVRSAAGEKIEVYQDEPDEEEEEVPQAVKKEDMKLRLHLEGASRPWEDIQKNPFKYYNATPAPAPAAIPKRELSTQITSADPHISENGERLGYNRALIYVNGDELSFEEVRAMKHYPLIIAQDDQGQEEDDDVNMDETSMIPSLPALAKDARPSVSSAPARNLLDESLNTSSIGEVLPATLSALPSSAPTTSLQASNLLDISLLSSHGPQPSLDSSVGLRATRPTVHPSPAPSITTTSVESPFPSFCTIPTPSYSITSPTMNTKAAFDVVNSMFNTPLNERARHSETPLSGRALSIRDDTDPLSVSMAYVARKPGTPIAPGEDMFKPLPSESVASLTRQPGASIAPGPNFEEDSDNEDDGDDPYAVLNDQENKPPGQSTPLAVASSSRPPFKHVLQPRPLPEEEAPKRKITNADIIKAEMNKEEEPWSAAQDVTSEFVHTMDRIDLRSKATMDNIFIYEDGDHTDILSTSASSLSLSTSSSFVTPASSRSRSSTSTFASSLSSHSTANISLFTPITPFPVSDDTDDLREQAQASPSRPRSAGPHSEDPYAPARQEEMLHRVHETFSTLGNFFNCSGLAPPCKALAKNWTGSDSESIFDLPELSLKVQEFIGEGVSAEVFAVNRLNGPDDSDSCYALKVQHTPNPWEFYISTQVQKRVSEDMIDNFIGVYSYHMYSDKAFLFMDIAAWSLQDVMNAYARVDKKIEEPLVMYYTIELLKTVQALHSAGFIHGEITPANLLIKNEHDDSIKWEEWAPGYENGWDMKGLRLIDYRRTINTKLFPKNTVFVNDTQASSYRCIEMMQGTSWTYQVDLFGVCDVIHCLLHGQHMEVEQGPDGKWKPKLAFRKFWQQELWKQIFESLLNVGLMPVNADDGALPDLSQHISALEGHLVSDPRKCRAIKANLCKQEIMMWESPK